jgi:hypothetical protein
MKLLRNKPDMTKLLPTRLAEQDFIYDFCAASNQIIDIFVDTARTELQMLRHDYLFYRGDRVVFDLDGVETEGVVYQVKRNPNTEHSLSTDYALYDADDSITVSYTTYDENGEPVTSYTDVTQKATHTRDILSKNISMLGFTLSIDSLREEDLHRIFTTWGEFTNYKGSPFTVNWMNWILGIEFRSETLWMRKRDEFLSIYMPFMEPFKPRSDGLNQDRPNQWFPTPYVEMQYDSLTYTKLDIPRLYDLFDFIMPAHLVLKRIAAFPVFSPLVDLRCGTTYLERNQLCTRASLA